MNLKIAIFGIFILIIAGYSNALELTGTCDNSSYQCELSLNEMQVCNDSQSRERYTAYFNGETAEWFSIIPNKFTLDAGECQSIRIFTVANCYADPGQYTAQLTIQGKEKITTSCTLDLKQGHFVDIDVVPTTQNTTQCEAKDYSLNLTNNTIVPNQKTERVDLAISGLPKEWYELETERILVEKEKPETINLKVSPPCDADFGTYEFTARATLPNPNFYDEDNADLVIQQGQSAQIIFGAGFDGQSSDACLETASEAEIKITNNGKKTDTYRLTLKGANFASLDKRRITLEPGKEETVLVKFAETAEEPGPYEFTLDVESTSFDYATSKTFSTTLHDCYNLSVEKLQGERDVCVEDKPVYRFSLTNDQVKPVNLTAEIEGISATLDKTNFTINPGEKKDITATIDVSKLAQESKVTKTDVAVELLIDTSGSMTETIDQKTKMDTAKTAIINLANNINQIDLGMRVFGQGELCESSKQLVEVKKLDIPKITDKVAEFTPKGKTPLAETMELAIDDFNKSEGKTKAIILVSDGKETCGGDIQKAAIDLKKAGIIVYTVGFDIDEEGKKQLQAVSSKTGGKYFNAENSEELINAFKKISQEMDILPSDKGEKKFTVKLTSDHFTYEKDFSLEISDCYNAAIVMPELNLCKGVEKAEIFSLINLGSEDQTFNVRYAPEWVTGESTITVKTGEEVSVPFTAVPPKTTQENIFGIKINSERLSFDQEKSINYLSATSCFGIDLILLNADLDASTCQGVRQTLIIDNRGMTAQEITFITDKPYVYMVDEKVTVGAGERKEVNFFVSPPFDLPQTTYITITATTNNGFSTSAKIKLNVFENQDSYSLEKTDIRVQDITIKDINTTKHNTEVSFKILNNSSKNLRIFNATARDYNAAVQIEDATIDANSTVTARMLVNLPEETKGKITVPILVETDQGTFVRTITFEASESGNGEESEKTEGGLISIGTGFANLLSDFPTIVLALLIVAIIALIGHSAYTTIKNETRTIHPGEQELAEIKSEIEESKPETKEPKAAEKNKPTGSRKAKNGNKAKGKK